MDNPEVNDVVQRLRSEIARIRRLHEYRGTNNGNVVSAALISTSPALQASSGKDSCPSTWKKIKHIGNIPRDCSRYVRRRVRHWLGAGATRRSPADTVSPWKKLKRVGNIPRDCSRFVRRQIDRSLEYITHWKRDLAAVEAQLQEQLSRCRALEDELASMRDELRQQQACTSHLLQETRQRDFSPTGLSVESKQRMDALYVAFEDRFRGTHADIKERAKVFMPFLQETGLSKEDMAVLDIGCGRGEWLELLREHGFQARGIDSNQQMVERCRERGLDAAAGDAVALLHDIPDASLGVVTAFHVIEHLPLETLLDLLGHIVRILKPGGLTIFETPNPENLQVGSCTFYYDPTHHHPLPLPLTHFLIEAHGLRCVQALKLHPRVPNAGTSESELPERLRDLLFGPQDYALIGRKIVDAPPAGSDRCPRTTG